MKKTYKIILALGLVASLAQADVVQDWDSATLGEKHPDGFELWGGALTARGVTDETSASGPNSAYAGINFTGTIGYKAVLQSDITSLNLVGGNLSVDLSSNVSGGIGSVGFKVWDADGSEAISIEADRYAVGDTFGTFSVSMDYFSTWGKYVVDAWGPDFEIDFDNIASVGLLFYDDIGTVNSTAVIYMDNFAATAIPEPASMVMVVLGGTGILFARRKLIS